MSECLFCKIVDGEIPSSKVYEDEEVLCFKDVDPQAPVHVLLIPKKHIPSTDEVGEDDRDLMGYMMCKIKEVAAICQLKNGYRVVVNCGSDGLQTVDHMHFHILGKKKLTWPPG